MLPYILVAAALLLSLGTGHDLGQTAAYFLEGTLAWSTLQLLGVVTLIEMLTVFLQLTGSLDRILAALRGLLRDTKLLIALVPSLMGLFPVPGGTVMSAPMVGVYGDELSMDTDHKAAVNLFFRHIVDQVFPFKPHLILAAAVLNVPLFTLIGWHLPVTVVSLLFGYWYLVGRYPAPEMVPAARGEKGSNRLPLWVEVMPFAIPLVLALVFKIDFLYAMAVGVLFGLATQGASRAMLRKMVAKGIQPKMLLILLSVMVFKTVVEHSGLVPTMAAAFTGYGIPPALLAFLLPMAVGMATGMETAVVALAFPLLVGLVPAGIAGMPYILVMMIANAVGSCLSPAHTCMAAGNEYYGANYGRVVQISLAPYLFRLALMLAFAWTLAIYFQS